MSYKYYSWNVTSEETGTQRCQEREQGKLDLNLNLLNSKFCLLNYVVGHHWKRM